MTQAASAVVGALDEARRRALARVGRWPAFARCRRDRALRLTVVASLATGVAFVLAVGATLPLLAVAPVLLGVPHVASDVRYLMAAGRGPAGIAPVLLVAAVLGVLGAPALALAAGGLAVVWAGIAAASRPAIRALVVVAAAAAASAAAAWPEASAFLLAQGHNAIAIGLAVFLVQRRRPRRGWIPGALAVAGVAAIALGGCDRWLALDGSDLVGDVLDLVVPAGAGRVAARRWIAVFAFAQALHYTAWLHLVPDATRASERPVSFRRSFQLLGDELGSAGARLAIAGSLALPAAALISLGGARRFYLSVTGFHVFLELAFVVALVVGAFEPGGRGKRGGALEDRELHRGARNRVLGAEEP